MNYINHQSDFGEKFNLKLSDLEKQIKEIYEVRDNYPIEDNSIRLHSSTIDYKSTYACLRAILENKITMGNLVKSYENFIRTQNLLTCRNSLPIT